MATFLPMPDATIEALAVYSWNNQTETAAGRVMCEGTMLVRLPYSEGDGYTAAYDQWQGAEAAAEVIGAGDVGLAVLIGGVWYDANQGALLDM